jgi:flagellin-like hook-associated protein FlgL
MADLPRIDAVPARPGSPLFSSLDDMLDNPLGNRLGTDINTVALNGAQLAALAGMSAEDAKTNLADYMQDFTKEIELDFEGWDALSDADQSMLLTADRFANLDMSGLGGITAQTGIDKNGRAIYENLTLSDLYSGGKASLSRDPAAAMEILNSARKGVTAERATIAATQAMNQHGINADEAAREATMRMESYIRDTDMAEAATELARATIVEQASMSMIKAAQQQSRYILDLLA